MRGKVFDAAAIAALVLGALALRLWNAEVWPLGLEYDEGLQGVDAAAAAAGQFSLFYREAYREPLSIWLAAPFVAFGGHTPAAARMASSVLGAAAVGAVYALALAMLWGLGPRVARVGAVVAGVLMLGSMWQLVISRSALPPGSAGFFIVLALLACAWSARTRDRWWLAGGLAGLAVYTYQPAKLLPPLLGLWLLLHVRAWGWKPLIAFSAGAIAILLPLLGVYVADPSTLLGRANAVSIFRPAAGGVLEALGRTVPDALGALFWRGDPNWHHNLPGRPLLDPWLAPLAISGVALAVAAWRSSASRLALVMFAGMLIPPILSEDNNPNTLRFVGLAPILFVELGGGAAAIVWLVARRWRSGAIAAAAACLVAAALSAVEGGSAFAGWAQRPEVLEARSSEAVAVAEWIRARPDPGVAVVLPSTNERPAGRPYQHRTIQFLTPGAPTRWLRVDDETAAADLGASLRGQTRADLVTWKVGPNVDADPKDLAAFLLGRAGALVGERDLRGSGIREYRLAAAGVTEIRLLPLLASDSGRLVPLAASVEQSAGGRDVAVAVRWQKRSGSADERVSYRLLDSRGRPLAQVDRGLLSNAHLATSAWTAGASELDAALLPAIGLQPGPVSIVAIVYGGGAPEEHALGSAMLAAPSMPARWEDVEVAVELNAAADGWRLFGVSWGPGAPVLWWEATRAGAAPPSAVLEAAGVRVLADLDAFPPAARQGEVVADFRRQAGSGPFRVVLADGRVLAEGLGR